MNTGQGRSNLYAPPEADVSDIGDADRELVHAGRGERLGAFLLDVVIPAVAWVPLLVGVGFDVTVTRNGNMGMSTLIGIALAVIALLTWIGITFFFVHRNGQSIAKRIIGIKVVRSDGSPASLGRIFWLRNVVNALPGAIPLLGYFYKLVDYLLIFGAKQQRLHAMIADTMIVRA